MNLYAPDIAGLRSETGHPGDRPVAAWLFVCAAMIAAMAVIGAITRLTESGLSIMEWAPLSGALPPLSEAEWQRLFGLYQSIPEYSALNAGLDLAGFKTIFWWEWVHRLWGRLIGLVFLLPLLWFWTTGRLRPGLAPRLWLLFVLGGLQGAVGWWMVASGFFEAEDVSPYRLAIHLGLALLLFSCCLWLALDLRRAGRPLKGEGALLRKPLCAFLALLSLTLLWGAFTAGRNAGFDYNSFPLMDGRWLPEGLFSPGPWYRAAVEEILAVQFLHRWLALATLAAAVVLWLRTRELALAPSLRRSANLLTAMAVLQVGLGIATLLLVVPVPLAALHQLGAIVLLGLTVACLNQTRRARAWGALPPR